MLAKESLGCRFAEITIVIFDRVVYEIQKENARKLKDGPNTGWERDC